MVCDDSFIIALFRVCASAPNLSSLYSSAESGSCTLVTYRGVGSEHVDQINTIFAAVNAIDTCLNPAYAIDIMFFSIRIFAVIMSTQKIQSC